MHRFKEMIHSIFAFLATLFLIYVVELYIISSFTTSKGMLDIKLLFVLILLPLTPSLLYDFCFDKHSDKVIKRRIYRFDFWIGTLFLTLLGYIGSVLTLFKETKVDTTFFPQIDQVRLVGLLVILLMPIKIYYSYRKYRYSIKENDEE